MAKKRILKKEIDYTFGDFFFDLLICQHFIPDVDKSKVESIMSYISTTNKEFICRVQHSPKGNKKQVKQYYNKLYQDLDNAFEKISKDIEALNPCPDKK
ncbi:MAG: hypothetical protein LBV72_12950 [Tannerella sp.]|nr:hypothetical protein [Tannerella sp.]